MRRLTREEYAAAQHLLSEHCEPDEDVRGYDPEVLVRRRLSRPLVVTVLCIVAVWIVAMVEAWHAR